MYFYFQVGNVKLKLIYYKSMHLFILPTNACIIIGTYKVIQIGSTAALDICCFILLNSLVPILRDIFTMTFQCKVLHLNVFFSSFGSRTFILLIGFLSVLQYSDYGLRDLGFRILKIYISILLPI